MLTQRDKGEVGTPAEELDKGEVSFVVEFSYIYHNVTQQPRFT